MRTAVIALTGNGSVLALKLGLQMNADVFIKQEFITTIDTGRAKVYPIGSILAFLIEEIFDTYEGLIFIMATGIVVRTIAPFIKSKTSDPAVIVLDEKGKYVISLLSGHIGGANKIATEIAEMTGGAPVITTSTDVNGVMSFDVFAVENNCVIENISILKYISSELVNGGKVVFYSDCMVKGNYPEYIEAVSTLNEVRTTKPLVILSNRSDITAEGEKVLYIRPRNLVLGIGCKRDTSKEQIKSAVFDFLQRNNKSLNSIKCLATIDLKKDEKGLLEFCKEMNLELKIILRQEIENIEESFTCSEFVKEKVGVASVAEPCSVLASTRGRLICKKTAYQGITLALSEEEKEYNL
jgi:cobalt-precorrin 5A hydrolase